MAERYVSALTGPEMDAALLDMAQHNSEAWAVGTRDGAAVSSSDDTYNNNSKYYATEAEAAAARAEAAVPAGTEGAVLFSQAQSLTAAQKQTAFDNIAPSDVDTFVGGAQVSSGKLTGLKLDAFSVASMRYNLDSVIAAGWYRLAKISLSHVGPTQYYHSTGLIFLTGFFNQYKPTKGVFSYTYDGGSNYGSIVQLGGVVGGSPTKLRLMYASSGSADGNGSLLIDAYYSRTGTMTGCSTAVMASGADEVIIRAPEAVADSPTGETLRTSLDIGTISSGRVTTTA